MRHELTPPARQHPRPDAEMSDGYVAWHFPKWRSPRHSPSDAVAPRLSCNRVALIGETRNMRKVDHAGAWRDLADVRARSDAPGAGIAQCPARAAVSKFQCYVSEVCSIPLIAG